MYDAVADDYCYPDTTILRNKLDLREAAEGGSETATIKRPKVSKK
jgi:hypothetical protein